MPSQKDTLDILEEDEVIGEEKSAAIDELELELHKEEKETKPPLPVNKIVLIFVAFTLITIGITIGIAALINAFSSSSVGLSEWIVILLMMMGGFAIIAGGISGFWGGQRNIPIRIVSPSDASVVGREFLICGYTIEDCLDNEVEVTIYDNKKEKLFEEVLPVDESGVFYTKIDEELSKKSINIIVEAWMVSQKSKKRKLLLTNDMLDRYNVSSEGIKLGRLSLFSCIFQDFTDKAKILFDPKRKEKGVIEKVQINEKSATNIFFPSKSSDGELLPFSTEIVANLRINALYFDIKRSRRMLFSLIFFLMALAYFIYPIISIFI